MSTSGGQRPGLASSYQYSLDQYSATMLFLEASLGFRSPKYSLFLHAQMHDFLHRHCMRLPCKFRPV